MVRCRHDDDGVSSVPVVMVLHLYGVMLDFVHGVLWTLDQGAMSIFNRRDAEFGNYTMVDIDGNDPNDEIDENLPLEVNSRKKLAAGTLNIPH